MVACRGHSKQTALVLSRPLPPAPSPVEGPSDCSPPDPRSALYELNKPVPQSRSRVQAPGRAERSRPEPAPGAWVALP